MPQLDIERRVITGTAAGLAREIGIEPIYVRVSLIVLTLAGGWGLGLYLLAWALLARASTGDDDYTPIPKAAGPAVRLTAFLMIATGLVVLSANYGVSFLGALVWPAVLIGAALVIGLDKDRLNRLRVLGEMQNRTIFARILLGLVLLFAGVVSASFVSLSFWQAVGGVGVAALVLIGAGIVFAPVVSHLTSDLAAERRRRIRGEERADMAAHLHDSVLQTLTLVQKQSQDPNVVSLARRQERELRTWLFEDRGMNPNLGFRAGLEDMMAQVEDMYQVPIEVVVVGDSTTDEDMMAMLRAAREAAANAARHSGAPRVDVFAEVEPDAIEIFVRDTGNGFDVDQVDDDRAGVRDSIIARMARHGGTATVSSVVGAGTEVELRLPRKSVNQPQTESTS